ncbi:MAG: hypothetical protein ABSA02_15740 [Trebonia sp.]|jgi:hypothetical protein
MKGRWPLLSVVAAVLICTGLAQTQRGHVLLRDTGLYETPAVYTELAFNDPGALPSALEKTNGTVKVSFGIHNVSYAARSYQWSIQMVHDGKNRVEAGGAAQTPAHGRTGVTRSVAAACVGGRLQVVVRLARPAESISFWVTCPPAAARKRAKR